MIPQRVTDRLLASLERADGGCLVSTYSTGSHGYVQIGWSERGKTKMALGHRVAWIAANGPIPDGLTVDHICRNRRCCNVEHLRLLSNEENGADNGNARKTHCKRGHEFTADNTYRDRRGHRKCRACAAQPLVRG